MPDVAAPPGLTLLPDETVLLATHRHWIVLMVPLLLTLVASWLLLTGVCPIAVDPMLDSRCPAVAALFFLIAAAVFATDWLTTWFVLTSERLVVLQQPLWLRSQSLRLSDIASLSLREGLLGRLFGFGDVVAASAATEAGRLILDLVPAPVAVRDRIAAAIAASGRP